MQKTVKKIQCMPYVNPNIKEFMLLRVATCTSASRLITIGSANFPSSSDNCPTSRRYVMLLPFAGALSSSHTVYKGTLQPQSTLLRDASLDEGGHHWPILLASNKWL